MILYHIYRSFVFRFCKRTTAPSHWMWLCQLENCSMPWLPNHSNLWRYLDECPSLWAIQCWSSSFSRWAIWTNLMLIIWRILTTGHCLTFGALTLMAVQLVCHHYVLLSDSGLHTWRFFATGWGHDWHMVKGNEPRLLDPGSFPLHIHLLERGNIIFGKCSLKSRGPRLLPLLLN